MVNVSLCSTSERRAPGGRVYCFLPVVGDALGQRVGRRIPNPQDKNLGNAIQAPRNGRKILCLLSSCLHLKESHQSVPERECLRQERLWVHVEGYSDGEDK